MKELEIIKPDDWHVHFRDNDILRAVVPETTRHFARSIVMPNLIPPILDGKGAFEYKKRIEQAIPHLPNPNDMLLVEDAGLFVEALHGFPGVYSSYVLKTLDVHGILKLMNHLTSADPIQDGNLRKAEFRAVAVLYKNGQTIVSQGVCPGRISHEPVMGKGFGFDPIFIPADLDEEGNPLPVGEIGVKSTHGKPFGAIPLEEKQQYSH